jgi:hypothetical protein
VFTAAPTELLVWGAVTGWRVGSYVGHRVVAR